MEERVEASPKTSYVLVDLDPEKPVIIYGYAPVAKGDELTREVRNQLSEKGFWFEEAKTAVFISLTPLWEEHITSFLWNRLNRKEVRIPFHFLKKIKPKLVNLNGYQG